MSRVLPILFNTEMVQAILDGRKTVTRRCIKYKYSNTEMKMKTDKYGTRLIEIQKDVEGETHGKNPDGSTWHKLLPYIEKNPPCKKGNILYVRETWNWYNECECKRYIYRADYGEEHKSGYWKPSIHMPKEAARIFLKVKDVRVERLQDITEKQAESEGLKFKAMYCPKDDTFVEIQNPSIDSAATYKNGFTKTWNSTIKKSDIEKYGWNANPWVWVIEFERCEKPEGGNEKRD